MANTKSAAKRARQTIRRTIANRRVISSVKNLHKRVRAAIEAGDKTKAETVAKAFYSKIDKAAKNRRVHPNKASRNKGQVARALSTMKAGGAAA